MRPNPTLVIAAALLSLAGCVNEKPRGTITTAPPAESLVARRLVLSTDFPRDTDGNGFPDTIPTRCYFFEGVNGFPLAIPVEGTLRFDLTNHTGKSVGSWTMDEKELTSHGMREPAGVGYHLELSLLDPGKTDRIEAETVDVRAFFTPTAPEKPKVSAVVSMHFGRTR